MRVYISGPISGYQDVNKEAFNMAELYFLEKGATPVNPHKIKSVRDTWESHMRADIAEMMTCDIVVTLTGWKESIGAKIEVNLAMKLGIPVLEFNPHSEEEYKNDDQDLIEHEWESDL